MDEEDAQSTTAIAKKEGSESGLYGRGKYKFWALAAILLLAFWSMFTGSVTLAGNLSPVSDDLDSPVHGEIDALELEDREKMVRQMWDVYAHSTTIRLPKFWQEAFGAAYEELVSESPGVRSAAVCAIAKLSLRSVVLDPLPVQSTFSAAEKEAKRERLLKKTRRRR